MTTQSAFPGTFSLTGQGGCDTVTGVDSHDSRPSNAWFDTPLGRRCLAAEQRLVRRTLETVFGEQLLQIGAWGPADS
ncbi:MAG: hypothetical protein OEQ25_17565, partial [Gammaproteobacteria bacterium]|nr:hypothetical protein [Gammaproteobacteria bacterium]